MIKFVFGLIFSCLILVTSLPAKADYIFKAPDGNSLVLHEKRPCTIKTGPFKDMSPEVRKTVRAATLHWEGKQIKACWKEVSPGIVAVLDETGDGGHMVLESFVKLRDV